MKDKITQGNYDIHKLKKKRELAKIERIIKDLEQKQKDIYSEYKERVSDLEYYIRR